MRNYAALDLNIDNYISYNTFIEMLIYLCTKFCENKFVYIRTAIFTTGHYIIDLSVTYFVTGAPLSLVTLSSIISPMINAVWYFVLDKILFSKAVKIVKN